MVPPKSVPVVCAIIEGAQGRVLIAQRPAHKHLALKWEFPGGKVEPGESPSVALLRELHEELGCTVEIVRALRPFQHAYPTVVIEMFPFVCRLTSTSPAPAALEHLALRWVRPTDLPAIDLAAADLPVVAVLLSTPPFAAAASTSSPPLGATVTPPSPPPATPPSPGLPALPL